MNLEFSKMKVHNRNANQNRRKKRENCKCDLILNFCKATFVRYFEPCKQQKETKQINCLSGRNV